MDNVLDNAARDSIAASEVEATASVFGTIGESLMSSVVIGAAIPLVGWALSSLGLAQNDGSQITNSLLQQLNQELVEVENTLTTMSQELLAIEATIQQASCNNAAQNMWMAITDIDQRSREYSNFVGFAGKNGTVSNQQMLDWASRVLDPKDGLATQLEYIHTALVGTGGQGVINACIEAEFPVQAGVWDDEYWAGVYKWMNYFYYQQTRGLLAIVEALHLKATEQATASAKLSNLTNLAPSVYQSICTDKTGSISGSFYCYEAQKQTETTRANIAQQFKISGAGYTNQELVAQYLTGGTTAQANLYPRSLENFTMVTDGANCSKPLTSASPCGSTVTDSKVTVKGGSWPTILSFSISKDAPSSWSTSPVFNQTGWSRSVTADFDSIFMKYDPADKMTPGQFMESHGFTTMKDKVFYTMDGLNMVEDLYKCFVDTDIIPNPKNNGSPVYCKSPNQFVENLMECGQPVGFFDPVSVCRTKKGITKNRGKFYNVEVINQNQNGVDVFKFGNPPIVPGWEYKTNQLQYSLPKKALETVPCSAGYPQRNSGGAFTLCGKELDDFVNAIIPSPASLAQKPIAKYFLRRR